MNCGSLWLILGIFLPNLSIVFRTQRATYLIWKVYVQKPKPSVICDLTSFNMKISDSIWGDKNYEK